MVPVSDLTFNGTGWCQVETPERQSRPVSAYTAKTRRSSFLLASDDFVDAVNQIEPSSRYVACTDEPEPTMELKGAHFGPLAKEPEAPILAQRTSIAALDQPSENTAVTRAPERAPRASVSIVIPLADNVIDDGVPNDDTWQSLEQRDDALPQAAAAIVPSVPIPVLLEATPARPQSRDSTTSVDSDTYVRDVIK